MLNLKQDNERLQKIVTNQSLQSSCSSLQSPPISSHTQSTIKQNIIPLKYSVLIFFSFLLGDDAIESTLLPSLDADTTLVQVNVFLGSHGSYTKYKENKTKTCIISSLPISPKSKWEMVDHLVIKGFKVITYF